MLQNPRKTLGFKKNMVYKIPPGGGGGGEVNHIQPVAYNFNVSQCDKSLSAGFIPINTWLQRAAMPFKPAQGHRLQVKIYRR